MASHRCRLSSCQCRMTSRQRQPSCTGASRIIDYLKDRFPIETFGNDKKRMSFLRILSGNQNSLLLKRGIIQANYAAVFFSLWNKR